MASFHLSVLLSLSVCFVTPADTWRDCAQPCAMSPEGHRVGQTPSVVTHML